MVNSIAKNSDKNNKHTYISKLALMLLLTIILQYFAGLGSSDAATTSNLSVIIYNTAQVQLKWTDSLSDEKYYTLEKRIDQGSFMPFGQSLPNISDRFDGTLSAGHSYTYRVRVRDKDDNSYLYTQELTFRTDEIEAPNSLTATPVSYNQIDLKWGYPNNKTYNTIIERRTENDTTWNTIANVGMGQNTFSDKAVASGVKYYYRVSAASNENVRSIPYSNENSEGYSLLYKPTELYGFALSQHDIQLTWRDNSTETAFIIERKSPDDGVFKELAIVPQNNNAYIDSTVQPDKIYTYRIKAVSGTTSSEYSDEISITSTYLKPPGILSSSCMDGKSIRLEWRDLTDTETGFEIWRKTGSNPVWALYDTMGRNATTYTDLDISNMDTYTYKIRAKINNNSVYSDFSNETSVWSATIPAPGDLKYEAISKTEIKLTWQDTSTVEEGFRVERKIGFWGDWYTIAYLSPNTVTYNDKWINEADTYYYRIKVYDRSNSINYSNEIVVSLKMPDAPTGLQANPLSSNEIQLNWKDNSINESGFVIEAKQFYSFKEVGRVGSNITSYRYDDATANRMLTFRIRAINGTNQSNPSNEVVAAAKSSVTYTDLGNVSWAAAAINNLASRNVFDAKPGSKFYPDQNISRGEYCAIIIRSLDLGMVSAGSYADLDSRHKYYKEIMSAAKLGIISPDKNNKIYPNGAITREQAAVMIALALKSKGTPLPDKDSNIIKEFADYKSVSAASADKLADVCGAGIITGRIINGKNYLMPSSYITRAEAAFMTYRAINL